MQIRILLILLVIALLLAATRRWRVVGLTSSAVLAALLVWFIVNQPATQSDPGIPAASSLSAAQSAHTTPVIALKLAGSGAPWRVSGTVTNVGPVPIRTITLNLERLDCPAAESSVSDCELLWRGRHVLRKDIAATSTIKIDESFYSHEPIARLKGVARDQFTVLNVQ